MLTVVSQRDQNGGGTQTNIDLSNPYSSFCIEKSNKLTCVSINRRNLGCGPCTTFAYIKYTILERSSVQTDST